MKIKTSTHYIAIAFLLLTGGAISSVTAGCAETKTSESSGQYIDDSTITAKVKSDLTSADLASNVTVNTYKGVVQLSGFVNNSDDKGKAEKIASNVEGVKDVKNDIEIKPQS